MKVTRLTLSITMSTLLYSKECLFVSEDAGFLGLLGNRYCAGAFVFLKYPVSHIHGLYGSFAERSLVMVSWKERLI